MRPEEVGMAKQDLRLDLGQQRVLGNIDIIMKTGSGKEDTLEKSEEGQKIRENV